MSDPTFVLMMLSFAAGVAVGWMWSSPRRDRCFFVKVDGEEGSASLRELIACYQKNKAADKRLSEATRILRSAQSNRVRTK